jgi:putative oxidoreductase
MYDHMGKLVLRLALGIIVIIHGIAKMTGGIDFITSTVTGAGLPPFLAYGVYVGEVLAPLLLIMGWFARIGAAVIAVNMLFAIALVHGAEISALNQSGGWAIELQAMFLFSAVALVLLGPGRYSVNDR